MHLKAHKSVYLVADLNIWSFYINSYKGLPREIWYLSLVMFINRTGAMVLPFLSLYLVKELGFSLTDVGLLLACQGVGSFIGSYTGGYLTDRIGHYPVQLGSLLLSGIAFFILMHLTSFYALAVGMLMTTICTDA